jgi:P-type Ca2+ transporter type 2C
MTTSAFDNNSTPAYLRAAEDVVVSLATDTRRGLTEAEAKARLGSYGRNELTAEKATPAWRKFLAQFQDVLVILLLIATGVSLALWLFERESALPYEAIAIFSIVLLNAVMGYVQTSRAERALAALRAMSAAEATSAVVYPPRNSCPVTSS